MLPEYFVGKRQNLTVVYYISGCVFGTVAFQLISAWVTGAASLQVTLERLGLWLAAMICVLTIFEALKRTPGYLVLSKHAFGIKGAGAFDWSEVVRITSRAHPQVKKFGRVPHWSSTYEFELKNGQICQIDLDKFKDQDKDRVAQAIAFYAVTCHGIPVELQ